jgi:adenylate kinase family enzyme
MLLGPRIVIVGASGSGKTTMARSLSKGLSLDLLELDSVNWSGKVGSKRDEEEAKGLVADFAARPNWVIEGVYGWLAIPAIPRASTLIWLDLPWSDCREGLMQRGPWRGATAGEHAAFLQWAEDYWSRQTSSSFEGHRAMFDAFEGAKFRLQSRAAIAAHVPSGALQQQPGS